MKNEFVKKCVYITTALCAILVSVAAFGGYGQSGKFSNVTGTVSEIVTCHDDGCVSATMFVDTGFGPYPFICHADMKPVCEDIDIGQSVLLSGDLLIGQRQGVKWQAMLVTEINLLSY